MPTPSLKVGTLFAYLNLTFRLNTMALAIFDLDHTLINLDSDYEWLSFLCAKGEIDKNEFEAANAQFYADYEAGQLDIDTYTQFALSPLTKLSKPHVLALREQFVKDIIEPAILPKAEELLEMHRNKGDHLLIITATNAFVVDPIIKRLGVADFLAIDVEEINGEYTGNYINTPTYKEGKVTRLLDWNKDHNFDLADAYFYSDSANDIPLLEKVGNPFATNPCPRLAGHAMANEWPILHLK